MLSLEANLSFDSAEFLSRRLDGFERTLNVLSSRLRVSFPTEVQLLSDLNALLHIASKQRQHCEDLSYLGLRVRTCPPSPQAGQYKTRAADCG